MVNRIVANIAQKRSRDVKFKLSLGEVHLFSNRAGYLSVIHVLRCNFHLSFDGAIKTLTAIEIGGEVVN